ncbi:MAG: GSCFA domain-containing protein [Prolixibacteraceae bacterium]|nr:GSCFA domain-containing protein [Prolixibacteraceae bacterium]
MNNAFRTIISPSISDFGIDHNQVLVLMGSCFTEHIGSMLHAYKFEVLTNPFGVMYNPASLARTIQMAIDQETIKNESLIQYKQRWHSFDFHGSFSASKPELVLENTRQAIEQTHLFLKKADVLFLTFGTAWVYEWLDSGKIVANCHQMPEGRFKRHQLSIEQITLQWKALIDLLHQFNPSLRIVLTLSPVRHLKDGFHANQLSKAILMLAIEAIIQQNKPNMISYFPAYEIMNDDLRDYRFYSPDMVHVSETAVQYVFDHFSSVYFNDETKLCIKALHKLLLMKKHRILTDDLEAIHQFAGKALSEIEILERKYPNIKFELEKEHFTNLLEKKRLH